MATTKKGDNGSGSIRRRSDGRWEARYTVGYYDDGRIKSHSVYGKTKREVRDKLTKILNDISENTYTEPNRLKLCDWLDIWLREYKINVRPATWASYDEHIRVHINPLLGEIRLSKLAPHDIQKAYNYWFRERGLSAKSIKNIHGALHAALEQARINGYLRGNPSSAVALPKLEKQPLRTMDKGDVSAFLKAIQGDPYEIPLFVALFTGLRQGELLGLTWDCVDFMRGTLLINKQHNRAKGEAEFHFSSLKNSVERSLTPATAVIEILKRQKALQAQWAKAAGSAWDNRKNLVFTTELGRYVNNKTLYMHYKQIVRALGMPQLRFHDLRHTFSVNSLQAGDDIKTVQENLGHSTAAFTLSTYAHATLGMKQESAKRMDAFIRDVQAEIESKTS